MEYQFKDIEQEVKQFWKEQEVYRTGNDFSRPKYYVLDMFPYPSGAGLHVGHPLGYVASDVLARYKRLKGYNVLHPMGFDSFGLPAEQYAIQTGQHPAITTEKNIATFKKQLDQLGFSYDWSRELRTSDPAFYKWTQWIFIRLFHCWYNRKTDRAENIENLIDEFEQNGNTLIEAACSETITFNAESWRRFSSKQKSDILLCYRLAYIADTWVNWCPALGTVLANDEVKEGVSERGGYPVERKLMKQWCLRITAYADRLLQGLEQLDWSDAIKETQRNWIGKSEGCTIRFALKDSQQVIEVFTTRPDTIFGISFITLAPEHEWVNAITTGEYRKPVEDYVTYAKNRSERDRMSEVKKVTGQFTGAYAIHPFTQQPIPVWIGEYVLATYGTGAVMGVPGHDERDHRFAQHFELPIISILEGVAVNEKSADEKEGIICNSGFLNGLEVKAAISKAIEAIEAKGIGKRKVNWKLRDAIFGRQRYWGEPIPVYYDEEGIPETVDENDLPILLPEVDKYLPTDSGEPPLARASGWKYKGVYDFEWTTMPGWAGSSWYYLWYEDAKNQHPTDSFVSREALDYWRNIDVYVGGDEHATGHLIYFRFWTKFLYDLGFIPFDEPAKKLINQGKIQGVTAYVQRMNVSCHSKADVNSDDLPIIFVSYHTEQEHNKNGNPPAGKKTVDEILAEQSELLRVKYGDPDLLLRADAGYTPIAIHLDYVEGNEVNVEALRQSADAAAFGFSNGIFMTDDDGKFNALRVVEKMSKSKRNVINPDFVVAEYGADAFRLYEMFLGPIEKSKPWDTKGIDGCFRFLKKLWRLFYNETGDWLVTGEEPTQEEWKVLYRTIKKTAEDIETLSLNTCVSAFMICVNELSQVNTRKRKILEPLLIVLSPFTPFVAEFLWGKMGNRASILNAAFPDYDATLLSESTFEYPVAVNGKTRIRIPFSLDLPVAEIEKEVITAQALQKYFEGQQPKRVIVVKGKMINVVV